MPTKVLYSVVAVVGIAAASGGAWWYQSRPQGPQEITTISPGGKSPAAAVPAAASAPRAAGVEVAKAERSRLQDDAQSVGTLRSRQSVMLRPEVAGRVKEIGFADGATVRRGQILVQLDDTLQRAEIKQAQAQVSIAKANLKRNQELVAQSFVAQRVLDESSANLQVADAQLALACARWSRMAIQAPFDGTVGMRSVNLGDYVKDGADLVNLEDISSMYADFRLPERYQGKLRVRQNVQLLLDAFPGRMFKATIEAIDPLLDVNGRSIGVRAVLPNTMGEPQQQAGARSGSPGGPSGATPGGKAGKPATAAVTGQSEGTRFPGRRLAGDAVGCVSPDDLALAEDNSRAVAAGALGTEAPVARGLGSGARPAPLRPGMFARVTTVFSIRDAAIQVPEEAIVPQGGRQFVIKVVEPTQSAAGDQKLPPDTRFVSLRQEVKLGARQQGRVEIVEGLEEGETVVVAGQQRLQRDGTALRIVELGRPGAARSGAGAPAEAASAAAREAMAPLAAASK